MTYIDHVPVRIVFDVYIDHAALSLRNHSARAAWSKVTDKMFSKYKTDLENKLNNLQNNKDIFHVIMYFVPITKYDICALYNNAINVYLTPKRITFLLYHILIKG